jgi:hypothetical protein
VSQIEIVFNNLMSGLIDFDQDESTHNELLCAIRSIACKYNLRVKVIPLL